MAPPRRILIAHADPQARDQVRNVAEGRLGMVGTLQADSFDGLMDQLRAEPGTDLVIVDLDLPGMFWEVGLRHLAANKRDMRIAVLFSSSDQDKLDTLGADFAALVPKQLPRESLAEVLERVLDGDAGDRFPRDDPRPDHPSLPDPAPHAIDLTLTGRQCDVLRLLSQGHSNLEIAHFLGIAPGTVKVHVNAAFRIFGVHNRVSAAVAFRDYVEQRSARARDEAVNP